MKLKAIIIFLSVHLLFSCGNEKKSASVDLNEKGIENSETSDAKTNVVVFFVPGLSNDIFSLLLKDPDALAIKKFNSLGSYSTESYFEDYSDLKSNLTALMSGKTTLIGHAGMERDSSNAGSWLSLFKKNGYHISYLSTSNVGSDYSAAIFPGKYEEQKLSERAVSNMIAFEPDFIWGMGTNQFRRRKDQRNLFEELSIRKYDLMLRFSSKPEQEFNRIAGIFNNYTLPDTIDLISEGYKTWNLKRPKEKRAFVVISLLDNLNELLSEGDYESVFYINEKIDEIYNLINEQNRNTLYLLINPFQTRDYNFNVSTRDSLSFSSIPKMYNQFNNPIWAFGMNAQRFEGNYRNIDLYNKIESLKKD